MASLLNKQRDQLWLLGRVKYCVAQQPLLLIGFTAYWVWVNMLFQTPLLFSSIETGFGLTLPLRLAPLGFAFLSYLSISIVFKKTRFIIQQHWFTSFLAVLMIAGGLLMIGWAELTNTPSSEELAVVSLMPSSVSLVFMVPYLLGSLFVGFASACLCIEFQRVFGTLGSQYVLYIGCLAVVLSCLILLVFVFLPRTASAVLFLVIPVVIAFCHTSTVRTIATKTYYTHGHSAKLIIPKKLLATSILHGLSIGVLMGYPAVASSSGVLAVQCLLAFIAGAVLLFALSILIKMDYNHLLYQVGFPLVALGALSLACCVDIPLFGTSLQLAGFSFIHLVMWGVCTYFIKNLSLPATWTIGVSTCGFVFGQLAGALGTTLLSQFESPLITSQNLATVMVFVILFASLLMMSSTNLKTGWGLARLDTIEGLEHDTDPIIEELVSEYLFTERQTSILILLIRGRSRRVVSEDLFISEETVKTHIQQIYRKLHIHSRQELIDIYENKKLRKESSVRKPLFDSGEDK